jgi:hypothetical protein
VLKPCHCCMENNDKAKREPELDIIKLRVASAGECFKRAQTYTVGELRDLFKRELELRHNRSRGCASVGVLKQVSANPHTSKI